MPFAECSTVNWARVRPSVLITHTACVSAAAQSRPTKNWAGGRDNPTPHRWQRRPGGNEADARVVTNRRSTALLLVADRQPRENRGRWCHAGPQRATDLDRQPGSRRVPITGTVKMPAGQDGALVTGPPGSAERDRHRRPNQPLPRPYRVQADAFGLRRYLQDDARRRLCPPPEGVRPTSSQSSPVHIVVPFFTQTSSVGNSHRPRRRPRSLRRS